MPRPDEGLIHEWLDGELSPEEAARVERLVAEDPEWGAAAAEARGLVAASSRILGALDAVPANVLPQGSRAAPALAVPPRTGSSRATFAVRPWMKVAAGLVLVAGTAYTLRERGATPLAEQEIAMSASALESAPLERAPLERAVIGPQTSESKVGPLAPPAPTISAPRPRQAAGADAAGVAAVGAVGAVGAVAGSAGNATEPQPQRFAEERARAEATDRAIASDRAITRDRAMADDASRERAAAVAAAVAAPPPSISAAPTAALRSAASGIAAKALSVRALEGCWRTETTAGADSVLATPTIVRTVGDSIVIVAGPAARPATVVRTDGVLRGVMNDTAGIRVAFRATRIVCPVVPGATPSPRR